MNHKIVEEIDVYGKPFNYAIQFQFFGLWFTMPLGYASLDAASAAVEKMGGSVNINDVKKSMRIENIKPSRASSPWATIDSIENKLANTEAKLDRILALLQPKPKAPRSGGVVGFPAWFLATWDMYPKRAGSNSKVSAFRAALARQEAGITPRAMQDGVRRYRAFCDAIGNTGTEYVMQGKRFFGPGREWENDWAIPEPEAKQPKSDQEWEALAAHKGLSARPGEGWHTFKQRIQGAMR